MNNLLGDLNNLAETKLSLTEPRSTHLCSQRDPEQAPPPAKQQPECQGVGLWMEKIQVKQTVLLLGVRISNKCESETIVMPCRCHSK